MTPSVMIPTTATNVMSPNPGLSRIYARSAGELSCRTAT